LAATGNQSFGYFGGGATTSATTGLSTVDRIDYGNDTATASPKGPLSGTRRSFSATGNSSFGYFGGGYVNPGNTAVSTVDRIDYSSDTGTAPAKGPLVDITILTAATGNSEFGYFANYQANVNRVDYANDTATAVAKGPLSVAKYYMAATSRKAYGLPDTSRISPVATNFGYFGGSKPSSSTVDRIDYSNDTATSSVKGPLSAGRYLAGATGNSSFGYVGGGSGPVSTVDRVDYSNDTATAAAKGPLSVARGFVTATGNASFGYFGGGGPGPSPKSTVDRVDYSNDTATASPKGPLSFVRDGASATGNSSFGYFGGGHVVTPSSNHISTVDRIDYSNDTATTAVKGPLSRAIELTGATGNANFGYFGGGGYGAESTVDRVDYSNDTATAAVKGPLTFSKYEVSATGNASFGYFTGVLPGPSPDGTTVDRIDYSNDTATASPKGPLSAGRAYSAGFSAAANALPQ